ncbi:hypothetical protein AcV5_002740 [Taiwanofungus camphoratus]|nr:hypothetical protein AcV5_002740 [Antrodia cinnamomea]
MQSSLHIQGHPVRQPIFVRTANGGGWRSASPDSPITPTSPLQTPRSLSRPTTPSDVHSAVSRLLGLTKQLQEVLHLWSLRQANERQVSDAFVLVGAQFNTTVNVFWRHNVDMSDLFHVVVDLRNVLESCLGEDASPQTLEQYMPAVRRVLYDLLQGLRSKQGPYWDSVHGERRKTMRLEPNRKT